MRYHHMILSHQNPDAVNKIVSYHTRFFFKTEKSPYFFFSFSENPFKFHIRKKKGELTNDKGKEGKEIQRKKKNINIIEILELLIYILLRVLYNTFDNLFIHLERF